MKASHDGRFHFEGLRPGLYRVRVTGPQGQSIALPAVDLGASTENETVVVRED